MWRKPMSKQHEPSQAVARTSRLVGTGLSPGFVLILMIAIKNKTNDCNEALIRLEFKMVILCLLWNKYNVDCSCLQ